MSTNIEQQKQSRIIDGVTYEVVPLPFGASRQVMVRIASTLATFAAGISGMRALSTLTDADLDFLGVEFGNASHYVDGTGKSVPLIRVNQETHFAGRLDAYLAWLLFSVEVNFGRFFGGGPLKEAIDSLKARMNPPAKPTTS